MESICIQRARHHVLVFLSLLALLSLFLQRAGAAEAGSAEGGGAPTTLQEELDRRCRGVFADICKSGNRQFCDTKLDAVARKGVGLQGQNDVSFRCYDKSAVSGDTVDRTAAGVYCVDNCGHSVRCKGTVKRTVGSFHTSRGSQVQTWIEEAKKSFCSPLQTRFDSFCSSRGAGSVGRWMGSDYSADLGCVSLSNLIFDEEGYCFNGCGLPGPCPGRPASEAVVTLLSPAEKAELLHSFESPCKPYEKCVHTPGEAVRCIERGGDTTLEYQDDLQRWLDEKCEAYVRNLCRSDPSVGMCTEEARVVMRKGFGHEGQKTAAYRCYDSAKIEHRELVNTSEYGVMCVDNCGKDVACGGTVNTSSVRHVTREQISAWIEEGKLKFCSGYQQAVQKACDAVFPGSLARRGVSTAPSEPVDDKWSCVTSPPLVYEGLGTCFNNCGGPTTCAGGRQATGAVNESVQRVLTTEQVDTALREVPRPCPLTDVCLATTRNPPTCEQVQYEIQPAPGETEESMPIGDGEMLTTEFTSRTLDIKIGSCFAMHIDIDQRQVVLGQGERQTVVGIGETQPPYRVSVQRSGVQVTVMVWYNAGSSAGTSLFYVQPGTNCVDVDPVVFTGLDPEAQITRSSARSISRTTL